MGETMTVAVCDPAAWARRDLARPGGVEKAAQFWLLLERLVRRHGWVFCPVCMVWWPPEDVCEHQREGERD